MSFFDMFKKEKVDFKATSTFGMMKVDDERKLFKIGGKVIPYEDLISFELLENGNIVTEGGVSLGRAAVGGAFFGVAGAGFGGMSKVKKQDKEFCTSMKILVTVKNQKQGVITVHLIASKTDKSKAFYSMSLGNAKSTLSGLNYVLDDTTDKFVSEFDNLKKVKELLDLGIITEDEFENKKQEILK